MIIFAITFDRYENERKQKLQITQNNSLDSQSMNNSLTYKYKKLSG